MIQVNNIDSFKNLSKEEELEHVHLTEIPIPKELQDLFNKRDLTKNLKLTEEEKHCDKCAKDFAEKGGCEGKYEPSDDCKKSECLPIVNDVCYTEGKKKKIIPESFENSGFNELYMEELYKISPSTFDNVNEVGYTIRNVGEEFGGLDFGKELMKVLPNGSQIQSIVNQILPSGDAIVNALQIKKILSVIDKPIKEIKSLVESLFSELSKIVGQIARFNPIKELGIGNINIANIFKEIIFFFLGPVMEFLYMFFKVILDILYDIWSAVFGKETIDWIINTFQPMGLSWMLIFGLNSINTFLWILNKIIGAFYG